MSELNICRICLRTEAKGYKFERFQLKYFYEEVIALKVNDSDGLPQWFCFECATMLHKFHKFKEKCYIGQKVLKELLWKGPITYQTIYKIDRTTKQLEPTLKKMTLSDQIKTFIIKDLENETAIKIQDNVQNKLQNADDDCETTNVIKIEIPNENMLDTDSLSYDSSEEIHSNACNENEYSPTTVDNGSTTKLKSEDMNSNRTNLKIRLKEFGSKCLNAANWKKVNLTEDEALKEFREKAEDPKYLDAAYKCRDCFKGFSKKDMLTRHVQTRHSEELGSHECRLCRMRFKWNCHLRKHIQQHYTKYECLRCHIVFHLDTSALLHEEYHSGNTKKCGYCNEEFSHVTTYYTHVRTHRSAHVCAACGAAFVSAAGRRQHARRAHAPRSELEIRESEDDEPGETFCSRCDIRFETRKAYEEHLFHSAMHAEIIKRDEQDDITSNKKILGKRLRAKITKELRKRKSDLDISIPVKSKRRKRIKRKHRKPSTCHQCGAQFETQSACMKHHAAAHPRTSFHARAARHICELCGASLAPGSVAVHQNMHSREIVHTCDTCGRQFHSSVGLKRHLVTHTGEKPFGCPLCDKRFTQSNSMKLHYRTFHLKQPYPKRNRKKKKETQNQSEPEESYGDESRSLPEPEMESAAPDVLPVHPIPVDNIHDVNERMEDENIHYLTLS